MRKMNYKQAIKAIIAIIVTASFAACTDYSEFSEADLKHQEDLKNYTEMFEAMFGKIDPKHDWGMNEKIGVVGAFSAIGTRAGEESTKSQVLVNRNQWTEWNDNAGDGPIGTYDVTLPTYNMLPKRSLKVHYYRKAALGHDIQVPGFPHLNGLYYVSKGNTEDNYVTDDQITSGAIPSGDITPYEIQYVSAWFRTHKNPTSIDLHLSDFFIQNVSCDFDQVSYGPLSTPYKEGWEQTGNNGKNISTIKEAQDHRDKDGNVYAENLTETISYDLDYLGFKDMDGNWTHVNNFNRGNSNFSPEDNNSNPNREIKYVKSAGTEDFTCQSSWSTGKYKELSKWVLVHLTWNETVKVSDSPYPVGTVIPREGYYLAFDFEGGKAIGTESDDDDEIVHRDGYYSNWIVKITPGHFNPTGNSRRIMCEDLGGSWDLDFNDAVIDVAFEDKGSNQYEPIIAVQATGATMPIYINRADKNPNYEIHHLLGTVNTTQVNVDDVKFPDTRPVAIYRGDIVSSDNIGQIKIGVQSRDGHFYHLTGMKNKETDEDERSTIIDIDGTSQPGTSSNLTDYTNKEVSAPCAFSVPSSVKWMKEYICIDKSYKNFGDWVSNSDWKSTELGNKRWYQIYEDEANKLYTPKTTILPGSPTNTGESSETSISWNPLYPDETVKENAQAVHADSYLRLTGYDSQDAIVKKLATMGDNDRVTFTVILSSANQYIEDADGSAMPKLEAMLIPADISGTTMSNNGHPFTTDGIKNSTRFNSASWVQKPSTTFGTEKVYTLQFSFTKADILNSTHASTTPFHDYLLLFLRVGGDADTVGAGTTMGVNNGVTVREWFVHY